MTEFIYNQQKFSDKYGDFVSEYFKLLTKYYQHWTQPDINCTYYSFDLENSLMDETKLVGAVYESVGELTGLRWRKILHLPLSNVEAVPTNVTADEKGVTSSDKMTSAKIPSSNQIEPHAHDFICFTEVQDPGNYKLRNPPLFEVLNVEKSPDFDECFYKVSAKITFITMDDIDKQVHGLFDFVDYEKKLYPIDDSICLNQILESRPNHCCNKFYNQNTGLYFDTIDLREL